MNITKYYDNNYLKYVIMFLAVINILYFTSKKNHNAIIFFMVVCVLTSYYTKHISIILLLAIITSNLFSKYELAKEGLKCKGNNKYKEGFTDNDSDDSDDGEDGDSSDSSDGDDVDSDGDDFDKYNKPDNDNDDDDEEEETEDDEVDEVEPELFDKKKRKSVKFKKIKKKGKRNKKDSSPGARIDYASSLENAYSNLQNIIGPNGIKGLTDQTKKLLSQQKNLMGSLSDMGPVIDDAQKTLKGFNLKGITNIFKQK